MIRLMTERLTRCGRPLALGRAFLQTRSIASEGVKGEKSTVNGERAKAARCRGGDEVRVRLGPYEHTGDRERLTAARAPPRWHRSLRGNPR